MEEGKACQCHVCHAWAGQSPLKCQVQSLSSPSIRAILYPLTYYSGSVAPSEQGHCSVFKQQSLKAALYQFYSLMGKERNQTRWDTCQIRWHRGHRVHGPSVPDRGLPLTSVWEKALQEDILYQNRWCGWLRHQPQQIVYTATQNDVTYKHLQKSPGEMHRYMWDVLFCDSLYTTTSQTTERTAECVGHGSRQQLHVSEHQKSKNSFTIRQ